MKTNITYIISNTNKALAFEWVASYLDKDKFNLNFILLNYQDSELENFIKENNFTFERIKYRGKKDIPKAIYKTYEFLKRNKTKIVHTQLFDANVVGLCAACLAGVKKRIHTRHYSNYNHVYFPKAVKYDRVVNWLSTDIVAISEVVKKILIEKENVSEKKIHLIHHGFLFEKFLNVSEISINKLNNKYNPCNSHPVIGVISRYTEWKGIQYIIPAFQKILLTYPNALLVLANAEGDHKKNIKKMLQLIPSKNYIEISFESDLFALYKLFDVFVHVPISYEIEAFGQTYVEALAAGVPSVFTISGVACEFVQDKKNALVVDYMNSEEIYKAVNSLLVDSDLKKNIVQGGQEDVIKLFGLNQSISALEKLYSGI